MKNIMVTNNVRCLEKWERKLKVDYKEEWSYLDVLLAARDYIHRGYFLLTHPLAGSVKPNQTPFKSIILSEESLEGAEDFRDLRLIEESIEAYRKFTSAGHAAVQVPAKQADCARQGVKNQPLPRWSEKTEEDFRIIDLSLMEGAMSNPIMNRR